MIPRPRQRIRAEPRTLHPSQPPNPGTPQFPSNFIKATQTLSPPNPGTPQFPSNLIKATKTLSQPPNPGTPQLPANLIKVKATQTLTRSEGSLTPDYSSQKFWSGGGGVIKRAATLTGTTTGNQPQETKRERSASERSARLRDFGIACSLGLRLENVVFIGCGHVG